MTDLASRPEPVAPRRHRPPHESGDLGAPLYVAWQITNECNLACLHCIEESGPGKAFHDELDDEQVFAVLEQADGSRGSVPVVLGRRADGPPAFLRDGRARLQRAAASSRSRPTATTSTPENCARLKALGVKAVQVSLDGASRATFNRMRVRGDFDAAIEGVRNLRAAGVPIEINFSPTRFNVHEIGAVGRPGLRARRLQLLHRAHDVHRQCRQDLASHRRLSEEQYDAFFDDAAREGRGVPRPHAGATFTRWGCSRSCATACSIPAALLIVLPNGLVKLINALPFVCGDLRRAVAARDLGQLPARVAGSARRAIRRRSRAATRGKTATLHQWVHL